MRATKPAGEPSGGTVIVAASSATPDQPATQSATKVADGAPTTPTSDVEARLKRVAQLLGQMSVPVQVSEPPADLIRLTQGPRVEVAKDKAGEKRPVVDAATFNALNLLVVKQTPHLRSELANRFEFLGMVAEAIRTDAGRWYFRVMDSKGQRMDVVFGNGLYPRARVFLTSHVGRNACEMPLTNEAARELGQLLLTARLAPPLEVEAVERDPDEPVVTEDPEKKAEREKKVEDTRQQLFAQAKEELGLSLGEIDSRFKPLLRELDRKTAEQLTESDLERMLSSVANATIALRSFELDSYDGVTLRLTRATEDGKEEDYIEIFAGEDDKAQGIEVAWLRICLHPQDAQPLDVELPLQNDVLMRDDLDHAELTPYLDVTQSPLGLALVRYATRDLVATGEVSDDHALLRLLIPPEGQERKVEALPAPQEAVPQMPAPQGASPQPDGGEVTEAPAKQRKPRAKPETQAKPAAKPRTKPTTRPKPVPAKPRRP